MDRAYDFLHLCEFFYDVRKSQDVMATEHGYGPVRVNDHSIVSYLALGNSLTEDKLVGAALLC